MSRPRVTLAAVNAALAAAGIKAELVRSRVSGGYHYFVGEDVELCKTTSEMSPHTTAYTVEQWVEKARALKAESAAEGEPVIVPCRKFFWKC